MKLETLLKQIKNNLIDPTKAKAIILEFIKFHLEKQDKKLFLLRKYENIEHLVPFDAFAPDGFDSFEKVTSLEIQIIKNNSQFISHTLEAKEKLKEFLTNNPTVNNFIYLFTLELTAIEKNFFNEQFEGFSQNVILWDLLDLKIILNQHPDFYDEYNINPTKAIINQKTKEVLDNMNINKITSNSFEVEWKKHRKNQLNELKKRFNNDELALFLGAGISLDAKIPTWDTLISNLMVSLIDELIEKNTDDKQKIELSSFEKELLIQNIKSQSSNSPLQLVRFIRNGLGKSFQEKLRTILYAKCDNDTSKLLQAITNLSVSSRNTIGLQGIITYNFDDLLEKNFNEKKVIKFSSIYKETDTSSKKELPIYHVHGFLPRDTHDDDDLNDNINEKNNFLVFSEEGYHDLILDPYHWANLVQLNFLKEYTCLFIGTSMTDPNVRRLLEISKRKSSENKHYVIFERQSFNKIKHDHKESVNTNNIDLFAEVHQAMKEEELSELGLNIIWIDSYDEIPGLLDELRK